MSKDLFLTEWVMAKLTMIELHSTVFFSILIVYGTIFLYREFKIRKEINALKEWLDDGKTKDDILALLEENYALQKRLGDKKER